MSGEYDWYGVRVYSDMVEVTEETTFGDIRDLAHNRRDDVPAGAVHKDGERGTFEDDTVILEELGRPPGGWTIVFEEPPLEEYGMYRHPGLYEE